MKKIDTTIWKEFQINDIFETINESRKQVPTGASVPKNELIEGGSTPRISVTGVNNGILGYFDYNGKTPENYRVYNNFISVSFLGTVFYQQGDASLDMKVHCLKPKHIVLNKYIGQFLVAAIKASLRESTYADQLSSKVLPEMGIKLPIKDKEPDWAYMEDYMKALEKRVTCSVTALNTLLGGG